MAEINRCDVGAGHGSADQQFLNTLQALQNCHDVLVPLRRIPRYRQGIGILCQLLQFRGQMTHRLEVLIGLGWRFYRLQPLAGFSQLHAVVHI